MQIAMKLKKYVGGSPTGEMQVSTRISLNAVRTKQSHHLQTEQRK